MKDITLLVVDDHPLFRQGVADALALEQGFRVVGQAADGKHALELIRDLEPDIAVLDVNLPEMNGQQITHQVNQEKLPTRILLLTGYDDIEQAIHAANAGAAAYCAKDIQPQSLVSVIREVANGKYVIGGNVFSRRELDEWLESQMEGARRSYSEPGSPPRNGSFILCGSWYEQQGNRRLIRNQSSNSQKPCHFHPSKIWS